MGRRGAIPRTTPGLTRSETACPLIGDGDVEAARRHRRDEHEQQRGQRSPTHQGADQPAPVDQPVGEESVERQATVGQACCGQCLRGCEDQLTGPMAWLASRNDRGAIGAP
jgi:hypothetical protein